MQAFALTHAGSSRARFGREALGQSQLEQAAAGYIDRHLRFRLSLAQPPSRLRTSESRGSRPMMAIGNNGACVA